MKDHTRGFWWGLGYAWVVFLVIVMIIVWVASAHCEDLPDYCGKGPVTIKFNVTVPCENATRCTVHGYRDSIAGYWRTCYTDAVACFDFTEERWTDYPECGGKKIDSAGEERK